MGPDAPYDWDATDPAERQKLSEEMARRIILTCEFWDIVFENWTEAESMALYDEARPLYRRCDELGTSAPENGDPR